MSQSISYSVELLGSGYEMVSSWTVLKHFYIRVLACVRTCMSRSLDIYVLDTLSFSGFSGLHLIGRAKHNISHKNLGATCHQPRS